MYVCELQAFDQRRAEPASHEHASDFGLTALALRYNEEKKVRSIKTRAHISDKLLNSESLSLLYAA